MAMRPPSTPPSLIAVRDLPVLTGERVVLRPWRPEEASWYVAARDEEIFRWTTEPPDLTEEDVRTAMAAQADSPAVAGFAIAGPDDELLGNLAVERSAPEVAQVSYWVAPAARGRGAASEGVRLASEWAFRELGVSRLELEIHPDNLASRRVGERAGYRLAGWRRSCQSCAGPDGMVVVYRRERGD